MALTATAGNGESQFELLGVNPDGTANWRRADGEVFNGVSKEVAAHFGLSGGGMDYAYRNPLAGQTFYDIMGNAVPVGTSIQKDLTGVYTVRDGQNTAGQVYASPEEAAYWKQRAQQAASGPFTIAGQQPQGPQPLAQNVLNGSLANQNMAAQNQWIQQQYQGDSAKQIPTQQPSAMSSASFMPQGLLSQPQTGLLGQQTGPSPLYPVYGTPNTYRRYDDAGPGSRTWMWNGAGQMWDSMSKPYLQSQMNPSPLKAPGVLASFDNWRQGLLAKPQQAQQAQQIGTGLNPRTGLPFIPLDG